MTNILAKYRVQKLEFVHPFPLFHVWLQDAFITLLLAFAPLEILQVGFSILVLEIPSYKVYLIVGLPRLTSFNNNKKTNHNKKQQTNIKNNVK